MLRNVSGILLLALLAVLLSGSACQGPYFNYCIISAKDRLGACSDMNRTPLQMDDWSCVSPQDEDRALKACRHYPAQDINYCVMAGKEAALGCADGTILEWEDADNYACLSPEDRQTLFDWCSRR